MTIYDLRKSIMVTLYGSFWNNNNFARVGYSINGRPQEQINILPDELKKELIAIGSVDENISNEELTKYHISQWDALNIAIRHEYRLYIESDVDDSDIGKAINNIIK